MAEEFQAGVCGGNWWNSSRSIFGSSILCAPSVHHDLIGNNFAWQNHDLLLDMKSSRSKDESGNSDDSVVLQELPKHHQSHESNTLQMLGIGLSSSSTSSTTPDWNHTLINVNERADGSYPSIIQEDLNSSLSYSQETGVDCSNLGNNFSTRTEDASSNSFEKANQDFTLGMKIPITSSSTQESTHVMDSSFSNYPSLLQTLFDNDPPTPQQQQQQQQQQSLFTNNQPMNFPLSLNYKPNLNDQFSPSLPEFPSLLRPSLPKQTSSNHFPFSNSTSLYNTSANLLPSMHSQYMQPTYNEKSSVTNVTAKPNVEEFKESRSSSMAKKNGNNEPASKRPRIETPSPLPTFKVRKEKLGDRITALQQLVSPFGKTDTASVLHEAIEYIKFLHDQVNVLSTPYMKNGSPPQHQQTADKLKDKGGSKQELRSRGLCLVPISSTFPVATETTTDFWTPTFGGTFR